MIPTNKIILALDASTRNVGWCLAQGERYINSGVERPRSTDVDVRILRIARWTEQMLAAHDPDLVAMEIPTGSHQNLATDRSLARVYGNVEGVCSVARIPVVGIHPMTVKGTGFHKNATRAVGNFIGKEVIWGDEADAVGVWQAALGEIQARAFRNTIKEREA